MYTIIRRNALFAFLFLFAEESVQGSADRGSEISEADTGATIKTKEQLPLPFYNY